jgi:DNA-binding Lrp family transcriptional regulator
MPEMDDIDRKLIAALRVDGRAPLAQLAKRVGISRGTVQNRLDRLIGEGVLLGFTVRMRHDADAAVIRAIMMIEVAGKTTNTVIKALRGMPELHAVHTTNGSWDLVAEIGAASLSDFDRVLREVRLIDGVANSETNILLTSV